MSSILKLDSLSNSLLSNGKKIDPQGDEIIPGRRHHFLGLTGSKLNFAVSCFAGVGFLLFGYDQGVMGSLLTLPSFENTFPAIKASNNATLQGAVVALYEIGCMVSSLSTIYLGDKLGRLKIMFIGSVIVTIGGALQSCAYTVAHLTVARIVTGLGTGFITSTVPVYQSECSLAKKRGQLIMMEGSLIALGIAISYWVDFGLYFARNSEHGSVAWRFPLAFQCVFPIMLISTVFRFPESPRWLLKHGKKTRARIVFSALYDLPEDHPKIAAQIEEIEQSLQNERSGGAEKFSAKTLFSQGPNRNFHRVCLAFCSQMMQQISGINLITYYAGTIFESYIGMTAFNSRILAACNGTEYFLASLIGFWTIERLGRRFLLFWGALAMSVTMGMLTLTTYLADKHNNTGAGIAAAVLLFVFNSFFGVSYLGGTWLLPPELLSLQTRAPGAALSTAANWGFNFMVVMITPKAFESINSYTYTIFAAINLLMAPVIYFLYPETAGRSLEEMDVIFSQTPVWQPWKVVQIAKDLPFMHVGAEGDEEFNEKYAGNTEHIENPQDGLFEASSASFSDRK